MRRILLLALASLALAVGAAACGGGDEGGSAAEATVDQPAHGNAQAGEAIFADNCAVCHGDDGTGASGPDLTTSDEAADYDAALARITNGGGGMPAFGDQLGDEEIADVAAYVSEGIAGS